MMKWYYRLLLIIDKAVHVMLDLIGEPAPMTNFNTVIGEVTTQEVTKQEKENG